MKPKLYLALKLLICFLVLYSLSDWITFAYRSVLESIGTLVLLVDAKSFACGDACSLRIIAYLSLVISTPQLRMSQRLSALLLGFTVFICIDLASFYLWPTAQPFHTAVGKTLIQQIYGFVWALMGNLLLPLLVWIVVIDRHFGQLFSSPTEKLDQEDRGSYSES